MQRVLLFCFSAVLLFCTPALADSVKLGGTWIADVTVQNVTDGQMLYTTATGNEVTQPLAKIEGLKLTTIPDLATAEDAFEAKKYAEALAAHRKALAAARQPWLKHYVLSRMVASLDQTGKPVEATELFLQLVREKADAVYVSRPPTASLASATAEQKQDLLKRIGAVTAADAAAAESLKKMSAAIGAAAQPAPGATPATPAAPGETPAATPAPPAAEAGPASAVVLPKALEAGDPITQMLQQGKFAEALAAANEILAKPNNEMSKRLYQRGIAQLALAEKADNLEGFKDAGLSFMRVVVHFPGVYVGPSLIELGYIHQKLDRQDIATAMFERARVRIDEEEDPALAQRLERLVAGEAAPVAQP